LPIERVFMLCHPTVEGEKGKRPCVCVCVCERETETETETERDGMSFILLPETHSCANGINPFMANHLLREVLPLSQHCCAGGHVSST
jgi:hypothetical protein